MSVLSGIYGESWQSSSNKLGKEPTILVGELYLFNLCNTLFNVDYRNVLDRTREMIKSVTGIFPTCRVELIDSLECLRILGGKNIDIPTSFEGNLEKLKNDPEAMELGKTIVKQENSRYIDCSDESIVVA